MGSPQGIEIYGIGKWNEISAELLPKWDDQAIRVKASRLMGSQSLARYIAWKGNKCASLPSGACNTPVVKKERKGAWAVWTHTLPAQCQAAVLLPLAL